VELIIIREGPIRSR